MPDLLLTAWLSFREFTAEPPVSAAIAAMTMAGLKILGSLPPRPPRKWLEVPMVGLASYGMVPISITLVPTRPGPPALAPALGTSAW